MAHLIEYQGYVQKEDEQGNPVGPKVILVRSTSRKDVAEQCEAFEAATDYKVETYIDAKVLRVDVKQLVINLMGSSMGDLELVDIRGSKTRDGVRGRYHVLRRRAFEGCQASGALAILEHQGEGEYQWVLTGTGFEYLLENSILRPGCIIDWAQEAQRSAPDIFEG